MLIKEIDQKIPHTIGLPDEVCVLLDHIECGNWLHVYRFPSLDDPANIPIAIWYGKYQEAWWPLDDSYHRSYRSKREIVAKTCEKTYYGYACSASEQDLRGLSIFIQERVDNEHGTI